VDRTPAGDRVCSVFQNAPGAHPASYSVRICGSSHENKASWQWG